MKTHFLAVPLLATLLQCGSAGAKNIFDEDWTPPKSVEPLPPTPKQQTLPPPDATAPAAPVMPHDAPAAAPAPPALDGAPPLSALTPASEEEPAARSPVPGVKERLPVRKTLKEVYASQLADRSVAGRRKLAEALIAEADRSNGATTERFVLLAAAIDAAVDGGSIPLALRAADRMGSKYEVDWAAVSADAALSIAPKARRGAPLADNAVAALELANKLAARQRFATAVKVLSVMSAQAGAAPAIRTELEQRQRVLTEERVSAERYERDVQKLATTPDDPALNLSVGRYLCGSRNEWSSGLPLLAKGSDKSLQALAVQELSAKDAPAAAGALADSWWELAPKQPDTFWRDAVKAHAAALYQASYGGLSGLRQELVNQRIIEGRMKPAGFTELLVSMDGIKAQCVAGAFLIKQGADIRTKDAIATPVTFRFLIKALGNDTRVGYAADQIIFNWERNTSELRVDGGPANGRHQGGAGAFPLNQWVTIELAVSKERMSISIDGQQRYVTEADFSKVKQKLSIRGVSDFQVASVLTIQH